jgi:N-acetylmuramoyl-L-alanine amidase
MREELKMVGRTNRNAIGRDAMPGVNGRASIDGDGGKMRGAGVRGLALLGAVVIALSSFTVLGRERGGAAARPAVAAAPAAGASAEMVNKAEQHLSEIGYWAGPSGARGAERTRYAVLAFQRVEGRNQTGKLDVADIEALLSAKRPIPRETGYAHIEVDLQRQVLFVVNQNNGVSMVLPISSGSGKLYTFEGKTSRAVTPRGRFTVYRKVSGWRKAPLGMIYYPSYFNEGWAIHGSTSVPNYPASHGCIRIPIPTAKELSDITPVGTVVLVYDGNQQASPSAPRS